MYELCILKLNLAHGRNNWTRLPPQAPVAPYNTVVVKTEPSESFPLGLRNTSPSMRTYPTYDVFDLTPAEGYIRRTGEGNLLMTLNLF